ncbi:hypothetical protein [Bacillus sp. FSL R12-0069]
MLNKILLDTYKVSDDDVNKKLEEVKKQLGDKFTAYITQQGTKIGL